MRLKAKRIASAILAIVSLVLVNQANSGSTPQDQIKTGSAADLERDGKKLFLNATSASFNLAEFVAKR
jgi:hypothetical protein